MTTQKPTRRQILVGTAVGLASAACAAAAGPRPMGAPSQTTGDADLGEVLARHLQGPVGHVGLAHVTRDRIRFAGLRCEQHRQFEIGSITKTFTAALLAEAISRGEVAEDTRVGDLVDARGSALSEATLLDLASHRSGLPPQPSGLGQAGRNMAAQLLHTNPYTAESDAILHDVLTEDLEHRGEPHYSNLGVATLGLLLSRRAGKSYPQLLQERVLDPLGLRETTCPWDASDLSPHAPAGTDASGRWEQPWTMGGQSPAGSIRSTPADMAVYAQRLLQGWKPAQEAMKSRRDFTHGQRIGYCWLTGAVNGIELTWHNGGTGGFRSFLGLDPARHEAVVMLSSTAHDVDDAAAAILRDLRKEH